MRAWVMTVSVLMVACSGSNDGPGEGSFAGSDSVSEATGWEGPPAAVEQDPSVTVEYDTSIVADAAIDMVRDLGANGLYRYADNRAHIVARGSGENAITGIRVRLAGHLLLEDAPLSPRSTYDTEIRLPTVEVPEGIHRLEIELDLADGQVFTAWDEVRILFNVSSISEGEDGVLWLGTFEFGLLRYDLGDDPMSLADDLATPLRVDLRASSPGLGALGSILSVAADGPGVWAGTFGSGLLYVDHNHTAKAGDDIARAFEVPECAGELCGEDRRSGFFRYVLSQCVSALVVDGETGVWVGTFAGLAHFDHGGTPLDPTDDEWTVFSSDGRYDPSIARLVLDDAGRVWIVSFDLQDEEDDADALAVLDPQGSPSYWPGHEWGRFPALAEEMSSQLLSLAIDGHGLKWIGSTDGMFVLDDGGTPLDPSDDAYARWGADQGMPDSDIGAILPLASGEVLVSGFDVCDGDGGGVALLSLRAGADDPCAGGSPGMERRCVALNPSGEEVRAVYTVDDGMLDDDVSTLVQLRSGEIAAGTFNLLAAPMLSMLMNSLGGADVYACSDEPGPRRRLNPEETQGTMVGRDGVTLLRFGSSPDDKADDAILNL